jgi:hypothetical protein
MKNTFTTPADFWQERDFGAKISAVFEFLGVHWRRLGKCLVYFVLPVTLLMGIGLGLMTNSMFNNMGRMMTAQREAARSVGGPAELAQSYGNSPFGMFNFGGITLSAVGALLAFLLLTGTVFGYLRARLRLPAAEPVTPRAVWAEISSRLGRMLLVIALVGVAYLLFFLGFFGLVTWFTRGGGGAAVSMLLSFPVIFCLAIYLSIVLSLFFPILWLEDRSIFETVARCFQLIKGSWWATFGLLLVAGLIQSMMSIVFVLPQYAVMFGKMLHVPGLDSDLLGMLAQCIYAVGIIFTYTVSLLALAFQYFHLTEQKEGYGLRLLVDALGQPQATPAAHSSHYRPDDEGEY